MITSNRLRIWTLITHMLIIVGWGHGVSILLLLQFAMPAVGWLNGIGQLLLFLCILSNSHRFAMACYITGMVLLWTGIFYFNYDIPENHRYFFLAVGAVPFAVCTIIGFAGDYIRKGWRHLQDKL